MNPSSGIGGSGCCSNAIASSTVRANRGVKLVLANSRFSDEHEKDKKKNENENENETEMKEGKKRKRLSI
jgi:hypothetical protein